MLIITQDKIDTFTKMIETTVRSNPDEIFASSHNGNGKLIEEHTFVSISEEADTVAYCLRETWKLNKGDKVVLCYNSGLQFFASFLGCARAGVVAVLVAPPSQPLVNSLPQMTKLVNDCNAKLIIEDSKVQMLRLTDRADWASKSHHLWPNVKFESHMNFVKGSRCGERLRAGKALETSDGISTISPKSHGALDSPNIRSLILAMLQTYNIDISGSGELKKQGEPNNGIIKLPWLLQNGDALLLKEQSNSDNEKKLVTKNTKSSAELSTNNANNNDDNSKTHLFEAYLLVILFSMLMALYIGEYRVQDYFLMNIENWFRSTGQLRMYTLSERATPPVLLQYLKNSSFYPTRIAPLLISCIIAQVLVYGGFLHYIFKQYNTHFGGKRLHRNEENSPSSCKLDPPSVRSWESYQKQHSDLKNGYKLHPDLFTPSAASQKPAAAELDMDHVHINIFQLVWAFTFVGPFSYLLWKKASILLKLRIFLVDRGLLSKKPVDLNRLVGKLVLEQSQVIHYVGRAKRITTHKQGNIAGFFFPGKCTRDVQAVIYYYHL